jgi:hypothetical protein
MSTRRRAGAQVIVLLVGLLFRGAEAADGPRPPCGSPPLPAYPTSTSAPTIQSRTVAGWTPPTCLDWDGPAPTLLVVIAARLHESGGPDALLARFGAISRLAGLRYWSVTAQAWQTLIQDAFAVTDATGTSRREDFRLEELRSGLPLYAAQRDGRSSGIVIYRMRVIARTSDRIAVSVVNVSPVRASVVTLFRPGELQATYFLDRLGTDEWGYFGVWGVTTGLFTGGHAASSINRAAALFRHFVGIPSSQEPPAAQHEPEN